MRKYYSQILIGVLTFFCLMTIVKQTNAQVIFSEGFEDSPLSLPAGWITANFSQSTQPWSVYLNSSHTGTYSVASFNNYGPADNWVFSPRVNLVQGRRYILSFWYQTNDSSKFKVALASGTGFGQQETILLNNWGTTNYQFREFRDTFVCELSGNYFIGFQNGATTNNTSHSTGIILDDIVLSAYVTLACNNSIVAGTISSSVTSVCPTESFSLTNSGATVGENIRYAWQKSVNGTNWINIINGYEIPYSIQLSQIEPTYYRVVDTCLNTGSTAISNQVLISQSNFENCYCTPAVISCYNQKISNFTIVGSSFTNTSTNCIEGYSNYTVIPATTIYKGLNTEIKFTVVNPFFIDYQIAVWIDFNQNGLFEENEFFNRTPIPGASLTENIQCFISERALTGVTRLRIRYASATTNLPVLTWQNSCISPISAGEYEDYFVNIQNSSACNGAVNAGTISAPAEICPSTLFTIQVNGATSNVSQMRYAWQKSLNGTSWSNIQNESGFTNVISVMQSEPTWYRFVDTCLSSGQSAISNSLRVNSTNIFGCYCAPTQTSTCSSFGLDSLKLNTIVHAPMCNSSGYSNNNTISTTLDNGGVYNLYLKLKPGGQLKYVKVFIDYNRNGIMDEASGLNPSETVLSAPTSGNVISANIIIPYNIRSGDALLRIIVSNSPINNACSFSSLGQTIDYKVVLNTPNSTNRKFAFYVKQNASGANNGLSWTNAYTSISAALSVARTGDTIRIAKGMYTPGNTPSSVLTLKDSIIVLGGYPDFGNPTDAQRNFSENQTIISGEIGGPGLQDNVEGLINAINIKGVLIDGFIIENFYAGYTAVNNWGPISINKSTIKFRNTVIRNNYNGNETCGLNILQGSIVTLENCFIEKNESYSVYGGVLKVNKSKLNIVNSVIAKNKAPRIIVSNEADISLKNSNVFKNYGFSEIKDTSTLAVTNSIFNENYVNYAVGISEFSKDSYSSIQIDNTITQFYNAGNAGFMGGNPMFIDSANIAGIDGKYFNSDDGLHLLNPCSKAINTGNNNYVASIANDITGATRIKNGIVDLGAYELQEAIASAPAVIYVNVNASGTNNGSSWNNAFRNLQQALNTCADTIKIATGIYKVSETDALASFALQNNVVIIGGYSGTGNNDIPNPVAYPTILDGTMANGEKVHTVVKSIDNNSNTKLINVEIKNTSIYYYGNQGYRENGALEVSNHSEAVFENVTISDYYNDASNLVLVHSYSKPVFRNCNFYNGDGNSNLGDITTGSYPKFLNCYFGKDTTATYPVALTGATMSISNAKAKIDSCIFYKVNMDALNILAGADVEIVSTQFIKTNGRSINIDGGNATFSKSIFKDTLIMRSFSEVDRGTSIHSSFATAQYTDCKFYDAYAEGYAPFSQITGGSNVTYKRCFFINGKTGMDRTPSGFYVSGSTLNLINSVISNPLQSRYLFECENGSELNIIGSTIIQQSTQEAAPRASSNGVVWCHDNSKLKLYNSVFWRYGNGQLNIAQENDVISSNLNDPLLCDIRNSYLFKQDNTLTQNSHVGIDPKFSDITNPYGPDNILGNEDDGYMLCDCSPLVNAGNSSLTSEVLDIKNQDRQYGSAIDIGAYEIREPTDYNKTFYVKENASANGNGKTWATAYNSLQKAVLNNCAEIIKVSQGTYKPSVYSRDSSFNIYRGVNIIGGYPNVGNPTDAQRDPLLYPTILSGEIGILNDSTDNILNIVTAHCPDSIITLEGLIIEKGNGGISANGCYKLNINNCIIRDNHTIRGGGAINSFGSFLEVNKTLFKNNTSGGAGGGAINITNYNEVVNSQPWRTTSLIKNSVFESNRSERYGGAIANLGSGTTIENSIFYKNEAVRGAGISSDNTTLIITNCNFIKNNITQQGYGIGVNIESTQSITFSPYCYNSVFAGNTVLGSTPNDYSSEFSWNNGQIGSFETPFTVQYNVFSNDYRALGFNIRYYYGSMFVDENNPKGEDGLWFTADDGLKPSPCSLLQDAGANDKVENIIPFDILGNVRILNNTVDIGAYEGPGKMKTKIVSSDTTLCAAVPITFRASTNSYSNTNNVYQWYLNGATVGTNIDTFLLVVPANNDKVWVTVINATCGTPSPISSDTIKLNIGTSAPIQLSITASGNNICVGTDVTFSSSFIGDIIDSTYQWKVNGNNVGSNSSSFSSSNLAQGDIVSLVISGQSLCSGTLTSNSNNITMNVSPNQTPDVQLSSYATSICQNQSLTFTAAPNNEGTQPSYEWFINGTSVSVTNQNTYTASSLTGNTEVKVVLSSSLTCTTSTTDTSNIVIITVNPIVTPSVSIAASATTICAGSSVTFTATPVNGGNAPIYQWRVNNVITGTNSPTFTSGSLINNDEVRVSMTSNQPCVSTPTVVSNPIIIFVSGSVVPTVSLQASQTTVCANSPVTFEAINETNLGNATYKWLINGNEINGATSSVFTYSNFMAGIQTISLIANSSLSCASPSNVIVTITVAVDAAVNPSISIPVTAEVEIGSSVNINATVQNAGTSPVYQWQDSTRQHSWQNISTGNQQQLIYTPQAIGDKLRVNLLSNADCASPNQALSNVLIFTVNDTTQIPGRIYLYPNPTRDRITVAGLQLSENWKTLDLIDMNGRKIIPQMNIVNQTSVQLTLGKYATGIYMVLLRKENGEHKYLKLARL